MRSLIQIKKSVSQKVKKFYLDTQLGRKKRAVYTYPLKYFYYFQLVSEKKTHALQVCLISKYLPRFTIHPSSLSKSALSVLWL